MSTDEGGSAISSLDTSQLNCDHPESPANGDEGTFSDAVESMHEGPPSDSSALAEDDVSCDGSSPDRSNLGWEMVDGKMEISFCPDYIVYGDIYCTDSKVTFSMNCVQVNGSTAHGNKGIFRIEFAIDDVIDIQSQWCGRFDMAEVKIRVTVRDSVQGESIKSTSGIEVLKFAVVDSYWYEKSEAIVSLNVRYEALWNVLLGTNAEVDQEALLGQEPILVPKRYFPKFDDNFEEVIYPEGDIDAVSISMRDVDLLKPDTFINDTVIDFYIKYLKNKILPEERHRFHFFNCFFFRKLADMDKDPSSAFEGRAAFLRVRKWTRKVNLFDKEFIFIPVNYNYHWSLIVICHPGEVAHTKDEDAEKSARVPCILHMDSLRGSHTNLRDLMQSYLWEEWKERQKGTVEDISSRFLNLRFVSLELPQQQNLYDCGLFLLHYVERFLEDAPANFSPFMITKLSNFLKANWFPPAEPSIKRAVIERLIYDLLKKHSQSPSGSSEKCCPSDNPRTNNDNHNSLELIVERLSLPKDGHGAARFSPSKDDHGHLLNSADGQGIEMDLPQASSFRSSQCASDSGLVLKEFFEPTSSAALLFDAEFQAFGRTSSFNEFRSGLLPIEEQVEAELCFINTTSTETGLQHHDVITPEPSALQYASEDYRSEAACDQRTSLEVKHDDTNSLPAKSTCDSDDTSEVEIAGNCPIGEARLNDRIDHPVPESAENVEYLRTRVYTPSDKMEVAGSRSTVQMLDHSDNRDPPTCLRKLPEFSHQKDANDAQVNVPFETMEVAGSQSPVQMLDHSDNGDPPNSLKKLPEFSHQMDANDAQENDGIPFETMEVAGSKSPIQMLDHSNKVDSPTCSKKLPEFSHQTGANDAQENDGIPFETEVAGSRSPVQMLDHSDNRDPPTCLRKLPEFSRQTDANDAQENDGIPFETMEVAGSQSHVQMLDHSNNGDPPTCSKELPEFSPQTAANDEQENDGIPCETMEVVGSQSHVQKLDHSDNGDPPTCFNNLPEFSHQTDANDEQENDGIPCETMEVPGSQSPVQMLDHSDNGDPPTCLKNLAEFSHQMDATDAQENDGIPGETMQVAGSQSPVQMLDHSDDGDPPTCLKNPPEFFQQADANVAQEEDGIPCDNMQLVADDLESEPDVHRATKKIRLMCPDEVARELSSTLSKDLPL